MHLAEDALQDEELLKTWMMCEGTWFVGVDALATGPNGEAGETALAGAVIDDLVEGLPAKLPMHKAQLSVVYPGYPKPRSGESEAAFRYRLKRDAAHVDGLHAIGPDRRRHLSEHHVYLLGLPLTDCGPDVAPLVVWRGSHRLGRRCRCRRRRRGAAASPPAYSCCRYGSSSSAPAPPAPPPAP